MIKVENGISDVMVGPTDHFLSRVGKNFLCFMTFKGPKLKSRCNFYLQTFSLQGLLQFISNW